MMVWMTMMLVDCDDDDDYDDGGVLDKDVGGL